MILQEVRHAAWKGSCDTTLIYRFARRKDKAFTTSRGEIMYLPWTNEISLLHILPGPRHHLTPPCGAVPRPARKRPWSALFEG